jgi:murein DD-endopeptidase MepM/ murein hydrolase activator NlpD
MGIITPNGHALGVVFGPPDPRTWAFAFTPTAAPPQDIDHRNRMRPVGNQLNLGSCTGWGGTAAVEAARQDGIDRAPLYLYYRDRQEDGTAPTQDGGATMLALCKALKDYGVPPEAAWPYVPSAYSRQPPPEADQAAALCRASAYAQVRGTGLTLLQGLWAALADGPCPIALQVYDSFELAVGADGKVPMPTSRERVLGGHCICACGWFNDQSAPGGYGYVLCQNSWGADHGQDGYYFLPAGYLTAGIVVEVWVVQVAAAPSPEPEPDMDVQTIRDDLEEARRIVDDVRYHARTPAGVVGEQDWSRLGAVSDYLAQSLGLLDPKDPPAPAPAPPFMAPVAAGAVYGRDKWLVDAPGGHSYGCDLFCRRNDPVYAPADCIVEEVIGGTGLSGGAEIIRAMPDKAWAWRYRHVQALVAVGQRVSRGQVVGKVYDPSLDMLCNGPVASYPDRWQHLDLSVGKGTDRFAPTGGGGGNYPASQWLQEIGYQGQQVARTPGPPSCGMAEPEAIAFLTPFGRRVEVTRAQ